LHQTDIQFPLNLADFRAFRSCAESRCDAAGSCPAGASDAVDEIAGHLWQIEVDDVCDPFHVDSAGSYIGRH
jgi:hypothetical protein